MLCLHDEVMGVGDARCLLYLLVSGVVDTERNVVAESVVEEDGLLVDIAYEKPEVVYAEMTDIDTVDEHLALTRVIISGYEVEQCRLARA